MTDSSSERLSTRFGLLGLELDLFGAFACP